MWYNDERDKTKKFFKEIGSRHTIYTVIDSKMKNILSLKLFYKAIIKLYYFCIV